MMKRLNKFTLSYEKQVRLAWWLLILGTVIYVIWIGYESVMRYDTFTATAFDLGNMDQAFWNTIHGYPFAFTNQGIDWYGPPTRLAVHFEPIILPLSVLYIFHSDPRILLVFQTLALSTGSLPVFLITRKYVPEWPLAAAVMAASYLYSPTLIGVNLFDFHAVALVTPLLLYALLALERRNVFWTTVTCVLAALCKEEIPAVVALLGVLVVWKYKMPRLGSCMFVGGILGSVIAFITIKHFFPGYQSNNFWYRYAALGSTPGQAIVNVLLHPWVLIFYFVTLDRIYYLANFFRNTGFLPLLSPIWMLAAIPDFAINLMSTDPLLYSGVYHYNAPIIPFVMLSAIHGLRSAIDIWHRWRGEEADSRPGLPAPADEALVLPQFVSQGAATLAQGWRHLYASVTARPVVGRSVAILQPAWSSAGQVRRNRQRGFNERMAALAAYVPVARLQWYVYGWIILMIGLNFVVMIAPLDALWPAHGVGAREQHIQQILNMIPPDAPVSAGDNLNPHLTDRQYITIFPQITYYRDNMTRGTVQYVVVDMNAVFPQDRVSTTKELDQLVSSGQFYMVARAEGVILLARRGT
jgi:uncharacterized membrane protein